MKGKVLILSLLFFISSIDYCRGCTCMRAHPQQHYCNSDFVILARVKRQIIFEAKHSAVYKVRVKKEFKISEKGLVALKSGRLHTSLDSAACGVSLHPGKLYVISGRITSLKAHVTLCNMVEEWKDVTKRQRKGLRLLYKQGCNCDITPYTYFKTHYRHRDRCVWTNRCETKEGICMRQPNGSCMWNKNKLLSACKREL